MNTVFCRFRPTLLFQSLESGATDKMSSRRKSTTPCMVLPSDVVEQDLDMETTAGEEGVENAAEGPSEGVVFPLDSEGGKG